MWRLVQHGSVSYEAQTSPSCRICFATQARSDERPLTEARPNWRGRLFRSSRSEPSRESARQPRQAIRGLDKILFPKFWSFLRYLQKQGAMLTMADNLHCGTLGLPAAESYQNILYHDVAL
jgi:hypothetical protein